MNCRIPPSSIRILHLYISLWMLFTNAPWPAAAQTPRTTGCANANATANSTGGSGSSARPCPAQLGCETGYRVCLGPSTTLNCALATQCIAGLMSCFNTAANNTASCVGLNQLRLAQVAVASGQVTYNMTVAYESCEVTSCHLLNSSFWGLGSNCTLNYEALCPSPVNTAVTILLQGPFLAVLANSSQQAAFSNALGADLTNAFRIVTTVKRLFIAGSRRQSQQTVVAEVEVAGVSASYAPFRAAFDAVAAAPNDFFSQASEIFMSFTGQNLTVLKLGIGSSSTAFSSPGSPTPAPPVTLTPVPTVTTQQPAASASPPATSPTTSTIFTATITPSFSLTSFVNLLAVKIGCSTSDISAAVSNGVVTFSFTSGDVFAYNAAARALAATPTEESALGVTGMAAQSVPVTSSPNAHEPGSNLSVGIIVGVSVGAVVALACVIAAAVICIRRQRARRSEMARYSDRTIPMMDDR